MFLKCYSSLTSVVLNPEYPASTRSISGLLMPWLLLSPGHQQPWYGLWRINGLRSSMRNNSTTHLALKKWNYIFMFLINFNVQGPSYLGLVMLLESPGHQQPWYWQCKTGWPLTYLRKKFNYLCHINVVEWHKMSPYVYVPSAKFST